MEVANATMINTRSYRKCAARIEMTVFKFPIKMTFNCQNTLKSKEINVG